MANPSKQKGTKFETSLLPVLRRVWPQVDRQAQKGSKDVGDFINVGIWTLEVKNCKRMDLSGWLTEARQEAHNRPHGLNYAVIHKKRGTTDPGEQYVTLPLKIFLSLMKLEP